METKYKISTEMELSETVYDLSTLIDISTHSDNICGNSTTENNATHNYDTIVDVNDVHENNMHENVHDDHSSMSAQTMLNLGLHKKDLKMGHWMFKEYKTKLIKLICF